MTDDHSLRKRRFRRGPRPVLAAAALSLVAAAAGAGSGAGPAVSGKLVVKGKTLTFSHAWLVRGPDTSDKSKPSAYLILSSQDLTSAIAACQDLSCVLWGTIQDGAILQPIDDGHESFFLRVVSPALAKSEAAHYGLRPEQQISGRRWIPLIDRHDRLAGRLEFAYDNTGDRADLAIDARLAREFPVSATTPRQ